MDSAGVCVCLATLCLLATLPQVRATEEYARARKDTQERSDPVYDAAPPCAPSVPAVVYFAPPKPLYGHYPAPSYPSGPHYPAPSYPSDPHYPAPSYPSGPHYPAPSYPPGPHYREARTFFDMLSPHHDPPPVNLYCPPCNKPGHSVVVVPGYQSTNYKSPYPYYPPNYKSYGSASSSYSY